MHKTQMVEKQELGKSRLDNIKKYSRFLNYSGVEHLPHEQKKIYKFD